MNLILQKEGMEYGLYIQGEHKKATLNRINTSHFTDILLNQKFTDVYFRKNRPNDIVIEIGDESVTIIDYPRIRHSPEISPLASKINWALTKHMTAVKLKDKKIKLYKTRLAMNDIERLIDDPEAFDDNPILDTPYEKILAGENGNEDEKRRTIYYDITYVGLDLGIPKNERINVFNQNVDRLLHEDNLQDKIIALLLNKKRELDKKDQTIRMRRKGRPTIKEEIRVFEWQKYVNEQEDTPDKQK